MAETWHYLENQFDNVTKGSNKLMNIITNDHHSRLKAKETDPNIAPLVTRYTPVNVAFSDKYSAWFTGASIYKSTTEVVNNSIEDLRGVKIKQWDIKIQNVYIEGTPEYTAILPNRRKPFQNGGIDERITQVKALRDRLLSYADLADVQTDVSDFYTDLKDKRDLQQQKEGNLETLAGAREAARKACANLMYGNLGVLMDIFKDTPDSITDYWEIQLLQSSGSTPESSPGEPITGTVAANNFNNFHQQALEGNTEILLKNTGTTNLIFCVNSAANQACSGSGIAVSTGSELLVMRNQLGAESNEFFIVSNPDSVEGSFEVIIG